MFVDSKRIVQSLLVLSMAMESANSFIATTSSNSHRRVIVQDRRRYESGTINSGAAAAATTAATTSTTTSLQAIAAVNVCKDQLLNLVSATPSGMATPKSMTETILRLVQQLEIKCPTPDDRVLTSLQGSWELLWTAQDMSAPESQRPFFGSWINPFENQSYANNPTAASANGIGGGRSNPFLPVAIQNRLEEMGLVSATPVRSTQAIDLKNGVIRNIVAFNFGRSSDKNNKGGGNNRRSLFSSSNSEMIDSRRIKKQPGNSRTFALSTPSQQQQLVDHPEEEEQQQQLLGNAQKSKNKAKMSVPTRASLTVSVGFQPVPSDPRRVDVKFDRFRLSVPGTPVEWDVPLGLAGPTGWLRTVYIDDDLRISRGHKGSVFVLRRPRRAAI